MTKAGASRPRRARQASPPGLRERKAARIRLRLVELAAADLRTRPFHEIGVDDLCRRALVSKVTFFKYFPTKDALLGYFSALWTYRLKVRCRRRDLAGAAALRFAFEEMARTSARDMHAFGAVVELLASRPAAWRRPELTEAEKLEAVPGATPADLDVNSSMGDFFKEHCAIARRKGEISGRLTAAEFATLAGALYHGSGSVGMRLDPSRPGEAYRLTFALLMRLLRP